ncbi:MULTISPECIES: major capsid protein [Streptomyces]|jgi:hypothetical protein|uniref:Major capsid protein n=1 Tax=Streptomyces sp. 900129855 TaxID=3155129 RepID=A0ABV2ZL91_9ACTN
MALEKLLEAIVPEDIQAFIKAIDTPEDYLLTREVFAERNIDNVKFRTKSSKRRVNAAKFRAWEAAPMLARRRAEQVINEGMLPWVGQELPFSELQIILAAVDRGQDTSEFLDLLYDDLEQHVEATQAAMEIAAGQMLSTGIVSLPGVALDVDWKVPAANRPTVAVPWSQSAAATPITDELAWIHYLKSIGAPRPERVITSEKALSLLGSAAEYRAAFHNSPSTEQIPSGMLAPEEVNRVRAKYNLPPVTAYDVQAYDSSDNLVRTTPESLWAMIPPRREQWGETQYGLTAEAIELRGKGVITAEEAPGIVITTHVQTRTPVQLSTISAAAAMPVLYVPDIHIAATVF